MQEYIEVVRVTKFMKNLEDNPACPSPDTSGLQHVNTAFSPFPLHLLGLVQTSGHEAGRKNSILFGYISFFHLS